MDISKVKIQIVRYSVTKCEIISPNLKENYTVPIDSIGDFGIDNDFESFYFPYFQMTLQLPSSIMRAIKKTPLDIHIAVTIQALYFDDYDGDGTMTPSSTSTFLNGKYIAYIEKQDRSLLDGKMEEVEEELGYDTKTMDADSIEPAIFSLYDETLVDKLEIVMNDVVTSGCLVDILTYVLNKGGITNVLLSPPNNYKTYTEFKLPPIDIKDHIDRICNDYAMHTNGTIIYYGLDRNYILDRGTKCTAYGTNEYQTTYLYYPGTGNEAMVNTYGCAKSTTEKANYILIEPVNFSFSDQSVAAEESLAPELTILDHLYNGKSAGKATYYAIRSEGDDNSKAIAKKISSYKQTAILGFRHIDVNMLTLNKQYVLTIDDKRYKMYNGTYRITKCSTAFTKDGNYFTPVCMCEFKV